MTENETIKSAKKLFETMVELVQKLIITTLWFLTDVLMIIELIGVVIGVSIIILFAIPVVLYTFLLVLVGVLLRVDKQLLLSQFSDVYKKCIGNWISEVKEFIHTR